MGMSASQARYLQLTERMNDIEYQGQQINQQRTTLSNQVNALNSSLLDLKVPTPPSTSDYTKVVYSGTLGASNFTLGNIVPVGTEYDVTVNYKKTGHYTDVEGTAAVVKTPATVKVAEVKNTAPTNYTYYEKAETEHPDSVADGTSFMKQYDGASVPASTTKYYTLTNGEFVEHTYDADNKPSGKVYVYTTAATTDGKSNYDKTKDYAINDSAKTGTNSVEVDNRNDYFVEHDGTLERANESDFDKVGDSYYFKADTTYYQASSSGDKEAVNPYYNGSEYTIRGANVMTLEQAKDEGRIKTNTMEKYKEALFNSHPELGSTPDEVADKFYIYYTEEDGNQIPHFVLKDDVQSSLVDDTNTGWAEYENYTSNGTYTSSIEEKGCKLEFDSDGRITKISIPIYENGELKTYKTVSLESATETDDKAYDDAYNQYQYDKHLYDKQQQEINVKTSIIQSQDKNLELKLTRLDNERNAVNTELEAVKKVIEDNIDKSFKTFSG